jgi:hypothetical protein
MLRKNPESAKQSDPYLGHEFTRLTRLLFKYLIFGERDKFIYSYI